MVAPSDTLHHSELATAPVARGSAGPIQEDGARLRSRARDAHSETESAMSAIKRLFLMWYL